MQLVPFSPLAIGAERRDSGRAEIAIPAPQPAHARWDLVDFIRAFAAMLVFLEHFAGLSIRSTYGNSWIEHTQFFLMHIGTVGSDSLLILSGFFDAKSVASPNFNYWKFLRNRSFRILPTYLAVVAFAVFFGLLFPAYSKLPWNSHFLPDLLRNLILLPKVFPGEPILTVSWMLSYIVFGYLTLPLFALAVQRFLPGKRGRVIAWSLAIAVGFTSLFFSSFLNVRILLIPIGCLLMEWDPAKQLARSPRALTAVALPLVTILLMLRFSIDSGIWTVGHPLIHNIALHSVSAAALWFLITLLIGWESLADLSRWTRPLAPIASFGQRGYAFYLIHGPITRFGLIALAHYFDPDWTSFSVFLAAGVLCFLASNLAAEVFYRAIELPIRQWRTQTAPAPARARAATA